MHTVRLDDDVFDALMKICRPTVDTPNSVIRRLLQNCKDDSLSGRSIERKNIKLEGNIRDTGFMGTPQRFVTSQDVYEVYVLYVLQTEYSGEAGPRSLEKDVVALMKKRGFITDYERKIVATGKIKAKESIAQAGNALRDKGYIVQKSPRGMWRITSVGIARAKQIILQRPRKAD